MKIFILILTLNLTSCKTEKTTKQTEDIYQLVEAVLREFKGVDFILCSESLDYSSNSIVTNSKSFKEALDIDLIAEFREFSPPAEKVPIEELMNSKDITYMKSQIGKGCFWEEKKLHFKVKSCDNNISNNQLALSKPLLNKDKNLSLVFLTKSTITEYTVTLFFLKKEKNSWQKVWSLNM